MNPMSMQLSSKDFHRISEIVYRSCGINLKPGKEALVRSRLMKRLRAQRIFGVQAYLDYIESPDGSHELALFIDAMTTNKTSFFRESEHFNYLRDHVLPGLTSHRLRFWSAACSSGEEPYTLAIWLKEHMPDIDKKDALILATDISKRMLEKAHLAVYPANTLKSLPSPQFKKYFNRLNGQDAGSYRITDEVRKMVRLAWLNLMESWPMKGPFNVIFCRNVMIYFDRPTQQQLINRFWELLEPGGFLFVGHSEGLSAINHKFRYMRPATYRK
ncbi:Chemotaxis protein methyltransferase CheR (EC [Olavius sp. associated proteobacterium Delta 1]|nr:Chemotaxis protein methyltransferase CheR (EC [Olavius sp. associated proteobacterium Delta 1]